jgi:hypothetical protein
LGFWISSAFLGFHPLAFVTIGLSISMRICLLKSKVISSILDKSMFIKVVITIYQRIYHMSIIYSSQISEVTSNSVIDVAGYSGDKG